MKKLTWDDEDPTNKKIACLGFFDGLHLGHLNILKETLLQENYLLKSLFFTFTESYDDYIKKTQTQIMDNKIKEKIIQNLKFDYYLEVALTTAFINLSAEEFLSLLTKKFNIVKVVIGADFRFGKDRQGNIDTLINYFGDENVTIIPRVDEKLSSTYIRTLLENHQIEEANKLLIENYSIIGIVKNGSHIGRKINFPTANIYLNNKLLIPYGVYITKIKIKNIYYNAMSCYFLKNNIDALESYILNFNHQIYNNEIQVFFRKFLRDNVPIKSLEHLQTLLNNDLENVLAYLQKKE